MLQFSELKVGMQIFRTIPAKYQHLQPTYYTIEATGADWALIRKRPTSSPVLIRNLLSWKLSKPRHKVYIRLMKARNGELVSVSSMRGYDPGFWQEYTQLALTTVEVTEGDGLENAN